MNDPDPTHGLPHSPSDRMDAACRAFLRAWRTETPRPEIESFVTRAGDNVDSVLLQRLLLLEWRLCDESGEAVQLDDYRARFPRHRHLVEDAFKRHREGGRSDTDPEVTGSTLTAGEGGEDASASLVLQVGDYELLEELGAGGMGVVFKAWQSSLNRLVAVKMIRAGHFASAAEMQRFRTEAESAAQLDHPGIVAVHEVGTAGGQLFYSMALVDGGSLAERVATEPLPPREAADLVQQISRAVHYAHGQGVVHRDLKPANILLDRSGRPYVTDFGLAKRLAQGSELTATGQILGTPGYMPPEQARGDAVAISERSDVYALGALLYRLVTGRPPFEGAERLEVLHQVLHAEPIAPRQLQAGIPRDLETICLRSLEKSPAKRYGSAEELACELDRFLADEPILARPLGTTGRAWRWCRRNPAVALALGAAVTSLLAGFIISTYFAVLADRRLRESRRLNRSLREANAAANAAREDAQQQARLALEQSELTLQTLETVIFEIQNRLALMPAAQDVRRDMLQTALEGLEQVSRQLQTRQRIDHGTAISILSLAEVYREIGNDEEGTHGATAADALYRQAIAILRELAAADPHDLQLQVDLAQALWMFGNHQVDAARWEAGRANLAENLRLRRWLLAELPGDPQARNSLTVALTDWAYGEVQGGDREAARAALEEAHAMARELVIDSPEEVDYRLQLSETCEKLGDWHFDYGDHEDVDVYYDEMLREAELAARQLPDDPVQLMNLSSCYERLGNLYHLRGQFVEAREAWEESLRLAESSGRASPNNARVQWDVSVSYDKVALICMQTGDYERAMEVCRLARDVRLPLTEADPTNALAHTRLTRCMSRIGSIHEIRHEYAEAVESFRHNLQLLVEFQRVTGDERFMATIDALRERITVCERGAAAVESLAFAAGEPDSAILLEQRARAWMLRGDRAAVAETVEELARQAGGYSDQWLAVARLWCAGSRALPAGAAGDDDWRDRAMAALTRAASHGLRDAEVLRDEPEFEVLRTHPAFERLLEELEARGDSG